MRSLCLVAAGALSASCTASVMEFVKVGSAGNASDVHGGGYGAVNRAYAIGKYEVTAAQYTVFLNSVAADDTFGVYEEAMSGEFGCGIVRSGVPGSYGYSVAADQGNRPVNFVDYWSSLRFANWMHNGRPTGPQNASTTEDGAYAINGYNEWQGLNIQRKPDARFFLPNHDEWYKAAYYDPFAHAYHDFPTGTDVAPSNQWIEPDPGNSANFSPEGVPTIGAPYYRTPVGEFENSASPFGTFDQGGNVMEWYEEAVFIDIDRAYRGAAGGWWGSTFDLELAAYDGGVGHVPTYGAHFQGFRIAAIPEPGSVILCLGLVSLRGLKRR